MPPRKKTGRRTRRSPRRRKSGNNVKRAIVFTAAFIVLLFAGLYGLRTLKPLISGENEREDATTAVTQAEIEKIDTEVTKSLFNLGISSKNIVGKEVVSQTRKNPEYTSIDIDVPAEIRMDRVAKGLEKSFGSDRLIGFEEDRQEKIIMAEIGSGEVVTHKIRFNFREPVKITRKEPEKRPREKSAKREEHKEADPALKERKTEAPRQTENSAAQSQDKPKIVIIVDDLGQQKSPVDKLLKIDAPINFAVLPGLPYSGYAARQANNKGRDVLLHLPMEPMESSGYTAQDAGENALLVGFPKEEILSRLDENLASVPHVKGINNHMGSKFMENRELMDLVLKDIKSRGLYFVDSKTSAASVGYETAKALGVRSLERDIFLDDASRDPDYIRSQIMKMIAISKKHGYAVGICHPYDETITVISGMMPELQKEARVISVSEALADREQFGKYPD